MKKIFSKISSSKTLFFVLFLLTNLTQAQDWIKDYPGIPIITYHGLSLNWAPPFEQYQQIDSAGVFALQMANLSDSIFESRIQNTGLLVMPEQHTVLRNYIVKYTEARYTEFEAEGTPPEDGLVTLYSDSLDLEIDNGLVSTKPTTLHGTMIYGPMYMQCRNYVVNDSGAIPYRASYILNVEDIDPQLESLQNDTVCILQVTSTRTWELVNGIQVYGDFYQTYVVEDSVLTYSMLHPGQGDTINIEYQFDHDFPWLDNPVNTTASRFNKNNEDPLKGKISQNCVEFKIIWKGKADRIKLSVDKIVISDANGRELKNQDVFPTIKGNIEDQIDYEQNTMTGNRVAGFIGLDEPWSIDMWEPIRMVSEIIDAHSQKAKLYFQFNVGFNGRFNVWDDPSRGNKHSMIDEFMRRVKKANVWITGWLYDVPCDGINVYPPCNPGVDDFRLENIDVLADSIYKKILDAGQTYPDLHYGMSIQTGKYSYSEGHRIREINSNELLYTTNLALMYGSKLLSPWLYFGYVSGEYNMTGFRNYQNDFAVTDKYSTLKDTIAPRLKGLFGKTLKRLIPSSQYAGSNGINYFPPTPPENPLSGYQYIEDIFPPVISQNNEYGIDLGFFSDPANSFKKFFMILNRYYSKEDIYQIYLKNLDTYFNWNLFNYVDTTCITLIASNNTSTFQDTILKGDANLYSISPVVKSGGRLIVNETVVGGTTLTDDMSIENGATLYVTGVYNSNANITVKTGGKIICSSNGKITFGSGKKLILEGTAQLLGNSSTDKLKLEFNSVTTGIEIQPNSSVTINNCEITGAYTGIASVTGNPSIVNISNTKINTTYSGISLTGTSSEIGSTPSIENCEITSTISGISIANYGEFLVLNNKLNNCGIYFSNVPASYIQGNNINGGASQSILGVFMNNSGGFIRKDTITNCLNAIQLANSSPDIGGCWIYNNKRHGIYIGTGSIPNLVGYYTTNPPTYFALSGYNKIDANGLQTGSTPADNDGSEIYLSTANILLNNGCNQISDDRLSTPSMNTQYLISGSLNTGSRTLSAIYNYWGTTTPTSNRYKNLSVVFSPYHTTACTLGGGSSSESLVLRTSNGTLVDSISSAEGEQENITPLQESYSIADNLFATGNVTQAKPLYEQIVSGNHTAEEKLSAYNKLYAIGNLTGEDENYFNNLQSTFEDIANNEVDTLIKKVYSQNAIKCDVSKEEYVTAINKFDEIIQQNPNSEDAVYAEIDIITTALNLDTTNAQLGKMGNGKYLVKGTSDYLTKLNDILQSKFGINSEEKEQIIPKEYSLYQNYPNPFNPTTTIKFDLPNDGIIALEIFDILGRRIATLIDDYKPAGSYEQVFNASSLASGVYVYKLQAGDFVSSKKMILLK